MEEIEVTVHELQGSPPPVRSERRSELQADSSVSTPFAVSGSGLLKIDLPPPFKGDGTESFSSWARRFEVAVEAMTAPDKDYSAVMSSVLPTRLTDAAFLFWDSLPPATKKDYHSVKEKLEKVFGPKYSLPFFQTHVNARPRQPGESLDVYSADITRLVLEAFPKYDRHALEGEKFRRFVAGLDPALQAKIHEQGAEDIEGALRIASRCERARVALQLNSTEHMHKAASVEQVAMVRPRPSEDQLLQAVEQLTLTVDNLRHEVHQLHVKHRHLADNFSPVSTPSSRFYYERDSTPEPYRSPRPRGYYSPERYGRDSVRVRKPSPPAHQEYRERDTERRDRYAVTNRYSRYDQPEYSRSDFGQRRSPSPAPRGRRDASPRPRPSVSEDFRNSHPALKKRPMTASTVPARSVNGQCLDILGTLTIGLRLGQKVWQQEVEVLRDYCGVVMPNTNCDVMVAHSVSSVQNGTTIVRVLNPSRDDIELHPGQHLGSAWFSTMDLQHGYWQVELEDCDREKTAFTTGSGLYHFKVMPMGLTNAPATCQRLMEMVLRGLPWKTCLVYLDDVLIYSRTFDEHLAHLEEVFCRLQTSGLKLNPSKCSFAQQQVQFLGHIVSGQGVQPDPRNVSSVQNWPIPRTATEVRAFLGLCSYYRKFIRGFAHRSVPLHALTEKNAPLPGL
ncbi:hypothetical protein WMY93_014276 [Mugilogobius chulae]|uniref:ribonuclease H n=1 Tax=Mugilogobius chulae TaxID=88201 RepID=A0AAW0P132_9GOBI